MLPIVEYNGIEYVKVDTINGKAILLKSEYVPHFLAGGVDSEGSLLTTENEIILNKDGFAVGYYGVDA